MVVPEHKLRDLGVEPAHVVIEQVVDVVPTELVQRLSNL